MTQQLDNFLNNEGVVEMAAVAMYPASLMGNDSLECSISELE